MHSWHKHARLLSLLARACSDSSAWQGPQGKDGHRGSVGGQVAWGKGLPVAPSSLEVSDRRPVQGIHVPLPHVIQQHTSLSLQ